MARTVGVRLLFAGTIALFALQLFLITNKTEPYPALTMPAFTGRTLEGNVVVVEKPEYRVQFAGEQAEVVPYDTLLPETPLDALPIFKNAFPFYQFAVAVLLLVTYGLSYSLGKIDHTILVVLAPLILSFAQWGRRVSIDAVLNKRTAQPQAQWPLRLLALMVGLSFFAAAWVKR